MTGRMDRLLDGVQHLAERLAERRAAGRAAAEAARNPHDPLGAPTPDAPATPGTGPAAAAASPPGTGGAGEPSHVPPPPGYAPAVAPRPEPSAAIPWSIRVAAEAGWRLLILAGVVYVLMKVVSAISLLVIAFSAGLLITALMEPTVARLKRVGLARGLATLLTFIIGVVIMGLVGWFVVWQVTENLPTLTSRVQDGIAQLKSWAIHGPFHVSEKQVDDIAQTLSDWLGNNSKAVTSAGLTGVTVLVEFLSGLFLAMFVTLFLLYDGAKVWNFALKFVPGEARPGVAGAGPRAWVTLTSYVRGTVIVAFIDAVFIGIGLWFLDVPLAVPLAVFIFLFAFIPIVGAVTSGALAVLVALVTNGVFTALMVLLVVLAVQQLEGHVLQPFILGRLVRVHPLGVVLAVTAGSLIAGIPGAVVAVPLVAVANTTIGYLKAYAHGRMGHYPQPTGATEAPEPPQPHGTEDGPEPSPPPASHAAPKPDDDSAG